MGQHGQELVFAAVQVPELVLDPRPFHRLTALGTIQRFGHRTDKQPDSHEHHKRDRVGQISRREAGRRRHPEVLGNHRRKQRGHEAGSEAAEPCACNDGRVEGDQRKREAPERREFRAEKRGEHRDGDGIASLPGRAAVPGQPSKGRRVGVGQRWRLIASAVSPFTNRPRRLRRHVRRLTWRWHHRGTASGSGAGTRERTLTGRRAQDRRLVLHVRRQTWNVRDISKIQ